MAEIKCDNISCQWNKKRKCCLFPGVTQLECRYRFTTKPKTTNKKGK